MRVNRNSTGNFAVSEDFQKGVVLTNKATICKNLLGDLCHLFGDAIKSAYIYDAPFDLEASTVETTLGQLTVKRYMTGFKTRTNA